MTDSWSFLLQTLTASGAAVLLLAVKGMFRDKLSPRWQFGVWCILALALLLPAGLVGRYALLNWPLLVEAFKSRCTGDFASITRVWAPAPLPTPKAAGDWFFLLYMAGAVLLLARYLLAYGRLRLALRRCGPADLAAAEQVRRVAERHGLPNPRAVQAAGLSSAFVCGIWRPVLVLPADKPLEEKIILHELLHLQYHDVAWGWLICLLKCLHWCNPLLWLCADWAANDMEALCDQRVLERLAGEERRDYGRILLAMASDKYARAPGTSSMANGGRNIRRRIEAIARFKKYPAGMGLPAACIAVALAVRCCLGTQAQAGTYAREDYDRLNPAMAMAEARLTGCTTYAGAFDCYAKALLANGKPESCYYRALCAPLEQQQELAQQMAEIQSRSGVAKPNLGLPAFAKERSGYLVFSLREGYDQESRQPYYEGLLALELFTLPEGQEELPYGHSLLAAQKVRVERQQGRWVALPQEDFWTAESRFENLFNDTGDSLPFTYCYAAEYGDFRLEMRRSDSYCVPRDFGNITMYGSVPLAYYMGGDYIDPLPQPGGAFDHNITERLVAVYTGPEADKGQYKYIGCSVYPWNDGQERPKMPGYSGTAAITGSSTDGNMYGFCRLDGDWQNPVFICGGGGSYPNNVPDSWAVNFYLNGKRAAELQMLPVEGDEADD